MNNNKDKYIISGNPDKRLVSLIFIVDENSDIESILSILKIIDVGKKYSLKNKIHYINDNFESFLPNIIEQLSSQVSS